MNVNDRTRKYKRYPFFATGIIKSLGGDSSSHVITRVYNISQGGMGVYAYAPIDTGTAVTMELSFANVDGERVTDSVHGNIVWINNYRSLYVLGISFTEELNGDSNPNIFRHFNSIIKIT